MLAVKPLFGTGVFARQTLDAVEADPSERELVDCYRDSRSVAVRPAGTPFSSVSLALDDVRCH